MKISMMTDGLEMAFDRDGKKLTMELKGRLDTSTSPELDAEMMPLLKGVTELDIELSALDFITSAGLRVLLKAAQTMGEEGERTVLNPNSEVREVLNITGFDSVFTIKPENDSE